MITSKLEQLKHSMQAPEWMTEEGYKILCGGYLLEDETPRSMYARISSAAAMRLKKPLLSSKFFDLFWNNWLGPASPVCSNMGTDRGLPISCFGMCVSDSVDGIMTSMHELAMMSKYGGGVAQHYNKVRGRGSKIKGNGFSDGVVPFIKIQDSVTVGISQGGTRRGASAGYLDMEQTDLPEFLKIRKPQGDPNRQCLNIHQAVCITDEFMNKVKHGDLESRKLWLEILKTRFETGEPYLFFSDNVNNQNPDSYKNLGLKVLGSNICTEIALMTDEEHSFVCCLSSMNLARWEEWKDTDAVQLATWFLDGVMEEFILKAQDIPGFERSVKFAKKSRALGLGVMGFHTLLQEKQIPFDSFDSFRLNNLIFRHLDIETKKASEDLAKEYGEPEWCKGLGIRNSHRIALAPTVTNAIISGNVSPSIEPWTANAFARKTAKGTFIHRNKTLEALLESKQQNTELVWNSIVSKEGSVQHLTFLTKEEKEIFLTAREINQFIIVKLAGQRQHYIDQAQSINLFFPSNVDPKYFHEVHLEAWEQGLKTLYYCRTGSVLKGDAGSRIYKREATECKACEG
jgi:ribonucleoside-diphosphate reductase alpha chain